MMVCGAACAGAEAATEIVFWHCMTETAGDALDALVAEFNATVGAEKGIHVSTVYQGAYTDAVAKMNSMLSAGDSGSLPDVMQLDATGKVVYGAADTAYTVQERLEEYPETDLGDYLPSALRNWNLNGVQLGVPFATSTTVTYYNKTALDEAGFEAPKTLADVGKMASLAKDGVTVYAAIPNTPTLANWLGQLGSDLVNNHNGTEGSATELSCIENGALVTFLTAWKALYASGALSNAASDQEAFAAGRLLVMTSSSSAIAQLQHMIGGRFELGVSGYPRVNAEAEAGATVSGSCLVLFDHGEARRAAAREFLLYMTGADVQTDFAMGTDYVPSNALAASGEKWQAFVAAQPLYQVALDQILATPAGMRSVTVGPSADFYYTIMNDVSDMLDQDLSPEETAGNMEEDLGGLLWQYTRANP
jgi:sn-glycerol 3-phosphate transport system substrate-binding protein